MDGEEAELEVEEGLRSSLSGVLVELGERICAERAEEEDEVEEEGCWRYLGTGDSSLIGGSKRDVEDGGC